MLLAPEPEAAIARTVEAAPNLGRDINAVTYTRVELDRLLAAVENRLLDEAAVAQLLFVFGVSLPALAWHLHQLEMMDWVSAVFSARL